MTDLERQIADGVTVALRRRSRRIKDAIMWIVVILVVAYAAGANYHG